MDRWMDEWMDGWIGRVINQIDNLKYLKNWGQHGGGS